MTESTSGLAQIGSFEALSSDLLTFDLPHSGPDAVSPCADPRKGAQWREVLKLGVLAKLDSASQAAVCLATRPSRDT